MSLINTALQRAVMTSVGDTSRLDGLLRASAKTPGQSRGVNEMRLK